MFIGYLSLHFAAYKILKNVFRLQSRPPRSPGRQDPVLPRPRRCHRGRARPHRESGRRRRQPAFPARRHRRRRRRRALRLGPGLQGRPSAHRRRSGGLAAGTEFAHIIAGHADTFTATIPLNGGELTIEGNVLQFIFIVRGAQLLSPIWPLCFIQM